MADRRVSATSRLWQCPQCCHVVRDLLRAPASARSDEYGGDPSADKVRLALTARRLLRQVGGAARGRVLEIGAGGGALAERLAQGAREVVAVDVRSEPSPRHPRVRRLTGRIEDLDLGKDAFDLVVGIHVLEHVDDVQGLLARVRGVLAPGGVAYFVTPNAGCRALDVFGADWWMLEDPTHVRFLSPDSIDRLARRAGFHQVAVRRLLGDSLAADGATLARRLQRSAHPAGVLATPAGRALAVAALPVALPLRAVRPGWRPALDVVLR